jgi:pimeloyl-ACP methyl ester carboxylesterase
MPTTTTPRGVAIYYDTFGDPRQPPVLLIQGLGAHLLGWREELCRQLADIGVHVVRFDNRDIGLSQKFPVGGYTLADMADDAAGLLHALGLPPAHVVGQSMGGMIAQQLAVKYPDTVASLTLIYTAPNNDHVATADLVDNQLELATARDREGAVDLYIQSQAPCASPAYPQDVAWLRELGGLMYDRGDDRDGPRRQMQAMLAASDRTPILAEITAPTTIIHGDSDRIIYPRAAEQLHQAIDGSTLTIHHGMGHELPRPLWDDIVEQIESNMAQSATPSSPTPTNPPSR